MSDTTWQPGQRVNVFLDLGGGNHDVQVATIRKVRDVGPYDHRPERCIQVQFDDERLMGGTGLGWVAPDQLTTSGA